MIQKMLKNGLWATGLNLMTVKIIGRTARQNRLSIEKSIGNCR